MKKILRNILKFFGKLFKVIYKIIDVIIVTPVSKFIYFIFDGIRSKNGSIDKFLNNSETLIYISLLCAFVAFFAVDLKVVNLTETEALVLSNQTIKAEY